MLAVRCACSVVAFEEMIEVNNVSSTRASKIAASQALRLDSGSHDWWCV
jgi:hypothetical protein